MQAYIQHTTGRGDSYRTESVECKNDYLGWQTAGLSYTASGYGKRIPTNYVLKYNNKWRRVYCCIYSNNGTLYIGKLSDGLFVTITD